MERASSYTKRHSVCETDRISTLPDKVISRILSLLPTKYAVATSILSTRWRFLWTSISNLDFDDELLLHSRRTSTFKFLEDGQNSDNKMKKLSFIHFVNGVLVLLSPQHVQKFRLSCSDKVCGRFYINAWICAALARSVQELNLSISLNQGIELPRNLFTCKTIVDMKLTGVNMIFNITAGSVCLPNLKILHLIKVKYAIDETACKLPGDSVCFPSLKVLLLIYVKYANNESVCKLFSCCPVLEDLVVDRTSPDGVSTFAIDAPALKYLKYNSRIDHGLNWDKLKINASELEELDLNVYEALKFLPENLSSLVKANIGLHHFFGKTTKSYLLRILKGISNVKFLSLKDSIMDTLSYVLRYIAAVYPGLTQLELRFMNSDWHLLPSLLKSSGNLEHLICIKDTKYSFPDKESNWIPPSHVPKCLLSHLKTVQINYIKGSRASNYELSLISYILKNAKVLEKMTIHTSFPNLEAKLELIQKMSMFQRGSPACQLEFI